jgi:type IV pilus assembly protein PilW
MKTRLKRAQTGITLIEVLVAVTIGLIATLAITQSFAISEGHRRTATSGGDATFSGALGQYTIQRDGRMAGYGLNHPVLLGCNILAYDQGVSPPREFNYFLAPVVITQGAGSAPDEITITYSNTDTLPAPIELTQDLPNPAANYHVKTAFGVAAGNLLVMAEAGMDCTLAEATNTPSQEAPGKQDLIIHNSGTYTDAYGKTVTARYNKPSGLGPNYTKNAILYNLGPAPVVNRYYVAGNELRVDQLLTNTLGSRVAPQIVQLQAQYGRDADGDGVVETWTEATPTNPTDWSRTLALRFALVARSALPETQQRDAAGACNTTTASPTWAGGTLDITGLADWRCYRYRVFESTTSLRNLIWRPA